VTGRPLRAIRAGAGLALLYVLVALATGRLSSRPVLPLFDGFAPPIPYAWVNPPPDMAGANVPPKSVDRRVPLGPDGAPASNVATDDAQAILGLDKGSVPARPPDTEVRVQLVPADVGTLGPLPPGLRAVSNAYQVIITYQPSQTPLTRLAVKGTIALTAAEAGDRLLYSADGQTWQETDLRAYGQDNGVFTELESVGWFVVASSGAPHGSAAGGSDALRTVLLVLAGAVPIVGAALVLRLPSPVAAAPPPGRRLRQGPRQGPKKPARRRR
jgi:hypothetical protein